MPDLKNYCSIFAQRKRWKKPWYHCIIEHTTFLLAVENGVRLKSVDGHLFCLNSL